MANNEKATPDASGGDVQGIKPSPSKSAGKFLLFFIWRMKMTIQKTMSSEEKKMDVCGGLGS